MDFAREKMRIGKKERRDRQLYFKWKVRLDEDAELIPEGQKSDL